MFMKKFLSKSLLLIVIFSVISSNSFAQKKEYKLGCIAFYNLENLFDTVDSKDTDDHEFCL